MFPIASNSDDQKLYVDDVFSTTLYTGNGSTQTINNGIDLAGKGGLTILKNRSNGTYPFFWWDSARGNYALLSDRTDAQYNYAGDLVSFNSNGFSLGSPTNTLGINYNNYSQVSWTFRKAAKFFDVVTWTGTGSARTIAHSLGVAPGMIIVKSTSDVGGWFTYHRSLGATKYLTLQTTSAETTSSTVWDNTEPTASVFTVGTSPNVNNSGTTYVAYLFAHDTDADGMIQCGSFTVDGSGYFNVNLGWEPQYVMYKKTSLTGNWFVADSMRGFQATANGTFGSYSKVLQPNIADAEANNEIQVTSTGFNNSETISAGATIIYMAIRRPNKPPTTGTQVFQPIAYTGNGTSQSITTGITGDLTYIKYRTDGGAGNFFFDRLRNPKAYLDSSSTVAEVTGTQHITAFNQLGFSVGNNGNVNGSDGTFISQTFKRAPGFFDVVCGTGTGANVNMAHNLGAIPELLIVRKRSEVSNWQAAWWGGGGANAARTLALNVTNASMQSSTWSDTATATTFATRGTAWIELFDQLGATYVAYLFATLAGISKVGSYTGNGSSQNIECGFAAGARFVLVKATSTTGNWLVADTARGIVSGNDPILSLNSTAAEVTGEDWLDPYAPGFTVNQTTASANASGVSYIFLAVS